MLGERLEAISFATSKDNCKDTRCSHTHDIRGRRGSPLALGTKRGERVANRHADKGISATHLWGSGGTRHRASRGFEIGRASGRERVCGRVAGGRGDG